MSFFLPCYSSWAPGSVYRGHIWLNAMTQVSWKAVISESTWHENPWLAVIYNYPWLYGEDLCKNNNLPCLILGFFPRILVQTWLPNKTPGTFWPTLDVFLDKKQAVLKCLGILFHFILHDFVHQHAVCPGCSWSVRAGKLGAYVCMCEERRGVSLARGGQCICVINRILEPTNVRGTTGRALCFVPLYVDARTGLGSSLVSNSFGLFSIKYPSIFLFPKRPPKSSMACCHL